MARRVAINFKEIRPVFIGPDGAYKATRVQRFDMPVTINSTDVDELGNRNHAGTVSDTPEVSITFQAMDVSTKIFAALTGKSTELGAGTGVDISDLGYLDIAAEIKSDALEDIVKSMISRYARISDFTFTYSVDGEATEEYTAQGTDKRWFKNDIIVDEFTSLSTNTLSQTPIVLKNGDIAISVILDGVYLTEVTGAPAAGEYSISGTTITTNSAPASKLVVVYHANPGGTNWEESAWRDSTIPAAVRGKNIPVKIASTYESSTYVDRVQSVTIRGTLPLTTVREMGNPEVVGYVSSPAMVEGDISVLDTDTEMIALFATGHFDGDGDTEFRSCEFTSSGISLEIQVLDPASSCNVPTASGTVLKTVYIPQLTVTTEGHSTNVGGNAMQTFGFKSTTGELYVYSGARS